MRHRIIRLSFLRYAKLIDGCEGATAAEGSGQGSAEPTAGQRRERGWEEGGAGGWGREGSKDEGCTITYPCLRSVHASGLKLMFRNPQIERSHFGLHRAQQEKQRNTFRRACQT